MRRDTIFYQLFRQSPTLLFDLISQPPKNAAEYVFESIEVKEKSFRIDGVFLPPDRSGVVFFCEVQFQLDKLLYERILSEISIYIYRNRERFTDWQVVVIYPTRTIEQSRTEVVREMLASGRIIRVYLDELGAAAELPTGLGLMVLTTLEGDEATSEARGFIARSLGNRGIIDAVSTIMVYKFSNLSRDEVDTMLGIELEQTRVYREAVAVGETIGEARGEAKEQALILRLLKRRVGNISIADADGKPCDLESRIKTLPLAQLEELGEALLDFSQVADLVAWLER
jgi:predicted transposase/invertase (TIGR01784 family)